MTGLQLVIFRCHSSIPLLSTCAVLIGAVSPTASLPNRRACHTNALASVNMGYTMCLTSGRGLPRNNRSIVQLIRALNNANWRVRKHAASELGKTRNPMAVPALLKALNDIPIVRDRTITALVAIGRPAVEPLITALTDAHSSWWEVAYAPLALGKIQDHRAVAPLITALTNDELSSICRMNAAVALGELKDPRAVGSLVVSLDDRSPNVRAYAGRALQQIGGPLASASLMEALRKENLAVVAASYRFFIRLGVAGTEIVMVHMLNSWGNIQIARAFMSSKNRTLAKAAGHWAKSYNIKLIPLGPQQATYWGNNR